MVELSFPCLCFVTDREQCGGRDLEEVVTQAVAGGANLVQLREKDLPAQRLYSLALRLRDLTVGRALLFINERVDVAVACGADGVQLGEEAMPVEAAQRASGGRLLVGRSVHSVEGARAAQAEGADLLVAGPIFATGSHPRATPAGVDLLERIGREVQIPVLAIGGVNLDNVESVMAAGAAGAAVISAISRSNDPRETTSSLVRTMKNASVSAPRKGGASRP